jgi:hypothetical protein
VQIRQFTGRIEYDDHVELGNDDLSPFVDDLTGYWLGTASFISGTKISKRCFAYLPPTPRLPLF